MLLGGASLSVACVSGCSRKFAQSITGPGNPQVSSYKHKLQDTNYKIQITRYLATSCNYYKTWPKNKCFSLKWMFKCPWAVHVEMDIQVSSLIDIPRTDTQTQTHTSRAEGGGRRVLGYWFRVENLG